MPVPTDGFPVPIVTPPRLVKGNSIVAIVGVEEGAEAPPKSERTNGPPLGMEGTGLRESSGSTVLSAQELQALVGGIAQRWGGGSAEDRNAENNDFSCSSSSSSDQDMPKRGRTSRSNWTREDDAALIAFVEKYGLAQWAKAGRALGRTGKQCRNRWSNTLEPGLKDLEWTNEEERRLVQFHRQLGSKWATLSRHMPGRSPNAIKNHWNNTIKCKEQRTSKRERCHVLRDYIMSLGGSVEGGHLARFSSHVRSGDPSSAGSCKSDPVRPPDVLFKTCLGSPSPPPLQMPQPTYAPVTYTPSSGIPLANVPVPINGGTRLPPESLLEKAQEAHAKRQRIALDGPGIPTGGHETPRATRAESLTPGATRADGNMELSGQGNRLNWIKRWAAFHPTRQARHVNQPQVPVITHSPAPTQGGPVLADRVMRKTEDEWMRVLAMINGQEPGLGEAAPGAPAVNPALQGAAPKPLTSSGVAAGIAVPSSMTSAFPTGRGTGHMLGSPGSVGSRKRSVSDRRALENNPLGWGRPALTSAPSCLLQHESDPSSLLSELSVHDRFPNVPRGNLPGVGREIPPAPVPVNQAAVRRQRVHREVPGATNAVSQGAVQRTSSEQDWYAAMLRSAKEAGAGAQQKPSRPDPVKPRVSQESPHLVALVTSHLRSLLDEQAEHLSESGDCASMDPEQVARLREQHLQIRSALSFLSSLAGIPDPSSITELDLSKDRVGNSRGYEDRDTTLDSVTSSVMRKSVSEPGAFEAPPADLERGPLGMLPMGEAPTSYTAARLRGGARMEQPGMLSGGPSAEDQRFLAQLGFLPGEPFPVEQFLPGLSQGLEIPAVSEEIPLQYAPVTPASEWERRFGHCTLDWPSDGNKKAADAYPAAGGMSLEALLEVPPDDTCNFLGGNNGYPGLGNGPV